VAKGQPDCASIPSSATPRWRTEDGRGGRSRGLLVGAGRVGRTYDDDFRVSSITVDGGDPIAIEYDANGNRLSATGLGGTATATYDAQDRLVQYGATTHTHTPNGERQSKTTGGQTTSYRYDGTGNLTGATLPNGTQIDYLLDGRGRRLGKKVNGTLVQGFLYQDGLRPVTELDGAGHVVSCFVHASRSNVPAGQERCHLPHHR
jgi:YD repeat-containing protein